MEVNRAAVKRNVLKLLFTSKPDIPKKHKKQFSDPALFDELILHLEMARAGFDGTPEPPDYVHREVIDDVRAKIKALQLALSESDRIALNRLAATQDSTDDDEFLAYLAEHQPAQDFKESIRNLAKHLAEVDEHLAAAIEFRPPRSFPDVALRNAIAPLLAFYRTYRPDARLTRDSLLTKFVVNALDAVGIPAKADTIGRFSLSEFPYYDWDKLSDEHSFPLAEPDKKPFVEPDKKPRQT